MEWRKEQKCKYRRGLGNIDKIVVNGEKRMQFTL